MVDCWKLFTDGDYKGNRYAETYWISKKGHAFLKEVESYNGTYTYKIKLMGSAPNVVEQFVK